MNAFHFALLNKCLIKVRHFRKIDQNSRRFTGLMTIMGSKVTRTSNFIRIGFVFNTLALPVYISTDVRQETDEY